MHSLSGYHGIKKKTKSFWPRNASLVEEGSLNIFFELYDHRANDGTDFDSTDPVNIAYEPGYFGVLQEMFDQARTFFVKQMDEGTNSGLQHTIIPFDSYDNTAADSPLQYGIDRVPCFLTSKHE